MTATAIQPDMFAPRPAVELPIARQHQHNPMALNAADCHREVIDCGSGAQVTILVARCADGLFRATAGYFSNTGGCGGPVFKSDPSAPSFSEARSLALLDLAAHLRTANYSDASNTQNAKILRVLEATPLDFWESPCPAPTAPFLNPETTTKDTP